MKTQLFFILLFLGAQSALCSGLEFSKPILYMEGGEAFAVVNLKWENAWNNPKNHDAIWVFFKCIPGKGVARHIAVLPLGHEKVADFSPQPVRSGFEVASDSTGVFIFPDEAHRGSLNLTVKIALDKRSFRNINTNNASLEVYGVEMVHIPAGGFTLGDPDTSAREYGSIFQPGEKGEGLPRLEEEKSEWTVAADGDIFYQNKEGYEGDQTGIIPQDFPKGVAAFYIMKYEITEGQYVAFLNTLNAEQRKIRDITQVENYQREGGSIQDKGDVFQAPYESKPCRFMSWEDAMAFADWAALRPMTEFEFTKAARGPNKPLMGEFPWGTNGKLRVQRLPNEAGVLTMNNGYDEARLSDDNLAYFAASYYWVMDLSGSLWERMVTIGHSLGRKFVGSNGDGQLSDRATATNADWPSGDPEAGGVGFRGGGFYGYNRAYHDYNPFSPIAYRPYGGWHGTMRSLAYGTRLVR